MNGHNIKKIKVNLKGFTLIELMITVAIMGILASVAYPSYTSYLTRSNRAEALRELVRVANLQEQFYVDNRTYTADFTNLGFGSSGWNNLESGNYKIKNTEVVGQTFTLRAQALGAQLANDPGCTILEIDEVGSKTGTSTHCWD